MTAVKVPRDLLGRGLTHGGGEEERRRAERAIARGQLRVGRVALQKPQVWVLVEEAYSWRATGRGGGGGVAVRCCAAAGRGAAPVRRGIAALVLRAPRAEMTEAALAGHLQTGAGGVGGALQALEDGVGGGGSARLVELVVDHAREAVGERLPGEHRPGRRQRAQQPGAQQQQQAPRPRRPHPLLAMRMLLGWLAGWEAPSSPARRRSERRQPRGEQTASLRDDGLGGGGGRAGRGRRRRARRRRSRTLRVRPHPHAQLTYAPTCARRASKGRARRREELRARWAGGAGLLSKGRAATLRPLR
mmetsp:Transcript_3542/g.12739  ORF Transcript_3542/g.12739 Transcript_3542/m.12739 type:complete len:303 (-) Transcript_3542:57-965(-)